MTTARPIAPAPNPESVGSARGLSARLDFVAAGGDCNFVKIDPTGRAFVRGFLLMAALGAFHNSLIPTC